MGSHQRPDPGRNLPDDIFDHLEHLESEFNSLIITMEASSFKASSSEASSSKAGSSKANSSKAGSSKPSRDSSNNEDHIDKGTTNGMAEDERRGQQITDPLARLYSLHQSYQQLRTKLNTRWPTTAGYSRSAAAGEEAASNVIVINGTQINESKSYCATIILTIVHQENVNRMEGKDYRHLRDAVFSSLKAFFSEGRFRGLMKIRSVRVLDSGDVEIVARTAHREDLERLIQETAWHEEFERSLGPLPSETYNVRMHNVRTGCIEFSNRKEKSAIVMTLIADNFPVEKENGNCTVIRDISWCGNDFGKKKEKGVTALMVEFMFPEHANETLAKGLNWKGKSHHCDIVDPSVSRCRNCQHYGHFMKTCSAEPRCGRCAGQHQFDDCTSTIKQCVLCDGPHRSADRGCRYRKQPNESLRSFTITPESPAIEPVAGVSAANKSEPEKSEIMFNHTQNSHTSPRTLFKRATDSRSVRMARDTGFQPNIPLRLKRGTRGALSEPWWRPEADQTRR